MLNETAAKPQVLKLVIVFVVFAALAFYVLIAVARGDFLWFNPGIDGGTPAQFRVYRYGVTTNIYPGQHGFNDIAAAVQQEIPQANAESAGGPSPDTISDVRKNRFALEVDYNKQITIHSTYNLGHPDTILIPFDGWEAQDRNYFLAANGVFGAWLPVLPAGSLERIKAAVENAGY